MVERGVAVDHTMLYRSGQQYAPEIEKRLRGSWKSSIADSWRIDETDVKVKGTWTTIKGFEVMRTFKKRQYDAWIREQTVWGEVRLINETKPSASTLSDLHRCTPVLRSEFFFLQQSPKECIEGAKPALTWGTVIVAPKLSKYNDFSAEAVRPRFRGRPQFAREQARTESRERERSAAELRKAPTDHNQPGKTGYGHHSEGLHR